MVQNTKPKVIIVDDSSDTRLMVRTALQRYLGIEDIAEADNGSNAWEMIRQNHYDLIVSDWNMPEMAGDELLREVRSSPKDKDTLFLMLTCRSHQSDMIRAFTSGAEGYIVKPIDIGELVEKVSTLLEKKLETSRLIEGNC
jgi:two-component system chemotaxis response regulator CheY